LSAGKNAPIERAQFGELRQYVIDGRRGVINKRRGFHRIRAPFACSGDVGFLEDIVASPVIVGDHKEISKPATRKVRTAISTL